MVVDAVVLINAGLGEAVVGEHQHPTRLQAGIQLEFTDEGNAAQDQIIFGIFHTQDGERHHHIGAALHLRFDHIRGQILLAVEALIQALVVGVAALDGVGTIGCGVDRIERVDVIQAGRQIRVTGIEDRHLDARRRGVL